MGILSDIDSITAPYAATDVDVPAPTAFDKGLRSSLTSMGGQGHALAGQAGEVVGANDFAANQRAQSVAAQQQAAHEQEGMVKSYKDVNSLRSGWDYAAGLLGSSLPAIGAGIAGAKLMPGKGTVPALAGATLATAPTSIGAQFEAQQNDPEQAKRDVLDRTMTGVAAGSAEALAANVVPQVVGGKLFSNVVGKEAMPFGKAVLRNAPEAVLGNAAAGAAGPAIGQAAASHLNPNRDTSHDVGEMAEGAVGGAVLGAPFGALGVAGDMRGAKNATPLLARTKDMFSGRSKEPVDLTDARKVANNEELFSQQDVAGPNAEQVIAGSDQTRVEKAAQWARDLFADTSLPPEMKDKLQAATVDLGDRTNQAVIAGMKLAKDAGEQMQAKVDDLYNHVFKKVPEPDAVRSEDTSGARMKIAEIVKQAAPDVPPAPRLADAIGALVEKARTDGRVSDVSLGKLQNVLGDKTREVLTSVHDALMDTGHEAHTDNFYKVMTRLADNELAHGAMVDKVRSALKPEVAKTVRPDELNDAVQNIKDFVAEKFTGNMTKTQAEYHKGQVYEELKKHFGDKTDSLLNAFAGEVKKESKQSVVDDRAPMSEAENGTVDAASQYEAPRYYGKGKDGQGLVQSEALHKQTYGNDRSPAADMLAKAHAENPDRNVAFVDAKDLPADHLGRVAHEVAGLPLEGHGIVSAEGMKQEGRLTPEQLTSMKLDTTKTSHLDSKSRIDTGVRGVSLDAKRVAATMKDLPYNASDDKGGLHRLAHTFMEGIAAAQDHLGKAFEVPDSTVVAVRGGKDVTFGELKKLKFSTETGDGRGELKTAKDLNKELDDLRAQVEPLAAKKRDGTLSSKERDEYNQLVTKGLELKERVEQSEMRENAAKALEDAGKGEADPAGNIHEAAYTMSEKDLARKTGFDGAALTYESRGDGLVDKAGNLTRDGRNALDSRLASLEAGKSAISRKLGERGRTLEAKLGEMTVREQMEFARIIKEKDIGKTAEIINKLDEKYPTEKAKPFIERVLAGGEPLKEILAKVAKSDDPAALQRSLEVLLKVKDSEHADKAIDAINKRIGDLISKDQSVAYSMLKPQHDPAKLDAYINSEKFNTIDDPAAMLRFLKAARERMDNLRKLGDERDLTPSESKAEVWAMQQFRDPHADLAMFLKETKGFSKLSKTEQVRMLAEVEALKGKEVAANMQSATGAHMTPADEAAIKAHIDKVLGPSVKTEFARMLHAGDFERVNGQDIIRVSVHSLDPMSVAYHESLHAFFAQLRDSGNHDAMKVMYRAADTGVVRNQLRKLLANEPEALKQVENSAEERVAYMYQFWAAGKLQLGDGTKSIFAKIADAFRKVLGMWSNDDRALHIMDYFHSGGYAKNMGDRGAVSRALDEGTNKTLQSAKKMTAPLARLSSSLFSAGDARLRDTANPALTKIADLIHRETTGEGADPGFIPAAREMRSKVMNTLAHGLKDVNAEHLQAALESLQAKVPASSADARLAAASVRKVLDDMYHYMKDAGVNVGDLGVGKDYFPRVWDAGYISSHQKEFLAMVAKYPEFKGSPQQLMARLMRTEGSEVGIETSRPGMQHVKERKLDFLRAEDVAPFLQKDLYQTMNSYITQGARRAEWARRFSDDGSRMKALFKEAQDKHGATKEEIDTADLYVKGVDGTLGDDINPTLRRAFGNMIVYQNIRLLPLAIFSSVIDPIGLMVRGGTVGDAFKTFKRGVAEVSKNFKKDGGGSKDASYQLAEDMGVIDNTILMHTLGSSYSQGMVGDLGRKVNDTFFRYNLMEQFNTSMRVGATEAAVKFIAKHADGTADHHSARWLAELGLKPGEAFIKYGRPLLRQHEFEAYGMNEQSAAEHANKMSAAVNKWVDGAILRPNAAHKPVWMNDPHYALFAHLKQFVYSFQETIVKRVMNEARHGNYSPAMSLAAYVPVMMAADLVKGMIQGGGSQPDWKDGWGPEDYLWSGVQRAGLLGVGQFGVDVATNIHRGGVGVGALTGPTVEQLSDAVHVVGGRGEFAPFALKSMPANALYAQALGGQATDPVFAD